MSKHTKITYESETLLIVRGALCRRAMCVTCDAEVEVITLDLACVASNLTPAELELWIRSEELHQFSATDGSTLVCLNSLLAQLQKGKPK